MNADPPLPRWCRLVQAANPSPMTLDGTNTYVIEGTAGAVVVDPGPLLPAHLEAVADLVQPTVVLLTHHHLDHSGGAARFHELTGAPVRARDAALCLGAAPLDDDETLDLDNLRLRVLHTPGHTTDSMCVVVSDDVTTNSAAALLSGDTILGRGTTVVAHPDGALGPYLASLELLRERVDDQTVLLPGHGPVRPDARAVVDEYVTHRRRRLDEVRAALASGARSPRDVVEVVYADVDPSLWPAAEASVRAQLDYLHERGEQAP